MRDALAAVDVRQNEPEAMYALRRAVSLAGWTSILRLAAVAASPTDVEFSRTAAACRDRQLRPQGRRLGHADRSPPVTIVNRGRDHTVQFSPDGRQLLTASEAASLETWDSSTGRLLHKFDTKSDDV